MLRDWYHITNKWDQPQLEVFPISTLRPDSKEDRDSIPCIHVCPSIAQCIIAVGAWIDYSELRVYKTSGAYAIPADWVFDYPLTQEHRILSSAHFEFVTSFKPHDLKIPTVKFWEMPDRMALVEAKKVLDCLYLPSSQVIINI